jgi:hypothetical protein
MPDRLGIAKRSLRQFKGSDHTAELRGCLMDFVEAVRAIQWELMPCSSSTWKRVPMQIA